MAYIRGTDPVDTLTCSLPPNTQPGTRAISLDLTEMAVGPQTWTFTVVPNATGNYAITCPALGQSDPVQAGLTVEGEATDPEPPTFSQATLNLRWDTAVATQGDKINLFTCKDAIALTLSPEGQLAGKCTQPAQGQDMSPATSTVTGEWNKDTGEVRFKLTTGMIVTSSTDPSQTATWVVTVSTVAPSRQRRRPAGPPFGQTPAMLTPTSAAST